MAIPGASKYRVFCKTVLKDGQEFSDHFDFDNKAAFLEILKIEQQGNAPLAYDNLARLYYWDREGESFTVK
jgi:hypothetical protein